MFVLPDILNLLPHVIGSSPPFASPALALALATAAAAAAAARSLFEPMMLG